MACHWGIGYSGKRDEVPLDADDEKGGEQKGLASKDATPREIHNRGELQQLLQGALNQLPPTLRKVFILVEIEMLSYEDTAKSLGMERSTVGSALYQARKRLRPLLPIDLLDAFLYSVLSLPQEGWYGMGVIIENMKLAVGIRSSLLLSYYMDGEASAWQRRQIEHLLDQDESYRREFQDFRKIKTLFNEIEVPSVEADLQLRFERRLAALEAPERPVPSWLPRPALLMPMLGVLIATFGVLISYPLVVGSPLSVTQMQGAVQMFDARTSAWVAAPPNLKIKEGMQLRTQTNGEADLTLKGQFVIRLKADSSVAFGSVFRSRQSGQIQVTQNAGTMLIGLGPGFSARGGSAFGGRGSRFSVETPYGNADAYGTLFLVEILPAQAARVMVLEGQVEVSDLQRTQLQVVEPQTERFLKTDQIESASPISAQRLPEVEELQNLPVPGGTKSPTALVEENLALVLLSGPTRVAEFLQDPRILTRKDFPVLTETLIKAKEQMIQSDQLDDPALYETAIRDLEMFTSDYLDPYGQFKPQIHFFLGAIHHLRGEETRALKAFARVAEFPEPTWRAMAHLARGILYEESLQNTAKARQEYDLVLQAAPASPEAQAARERLSSL